VIAAGVGDDASAAVFFRKRSYFVVSAPQLERADGLKIFRLKVELTVVADVVPFVEVGRDQFRVDGDATQARLRFANIVESDDENSPLSS
jgi:hypothetical protein